MPPWSGTGSRRWPAYADNRPVIVERAEGHHVVDVDGTRYLDAISSLWVTTLGHRVPELDDAVRRQLDRVAHTTLLGNGNGIVVELAEALAPRVPVDDPHLLFASDGAVAVEQALKIALQYWVNLGVPGRSRYLAFGGAYHGDTIGGSRWATVGSAPTCSTRSASRSCGRPASTAPTPSRWPAVAMVAEHAAELAAVVVEPLVQGAAGMLLHGRPSSPPWRPPAAATTCC